MSLILERFSGECVVDDDGLFLGVLQYVEVIFTRQIYARFSYFEQ